MAVVTVEHAPMWNLSWLILLAHSACVLSDYPIIAFPPVNGTRETNVTILGSGNNHLWIFRSPNVYRLDMSAPESQWHDAATAPSRSMFAVQDDRLFIATPSQLTQVDEQDEHSINRSTGHTSEAIAAAPKHVFVVTIDVNRTASVEIYKPYDFFNLDSLTRLTTLALDTNGSQMTAIERIGIVNETDLVVVLSNHHTQTVVVARYQGHTTWRVLNVATTSALNGVGVPGWLSPSAWIVLNQTSVSGLITLANISNDMLTTQSAIATDTSLNVAVSGSLIQASRGSSCVTLSTLSSNMHWNITRCLCFDSHLIAGLTVDEDWLYVPFMGHKGFAMINIREMGTILPGLREAVLPACRVGDTTTVSTSITALVTSSTASTPVATPSTTTSSLTTTLPTEPSSTQHVTTSPSSTETFVSSSATSSVSSSISTGASSPYHSSSSFSSTRHNSRTAKSILVPILLATAGAILAMLGLLIVLFYRFQKQRHQQRAQLFVSHSCPLCVSRLDTTALIIGREPERTGR
jgi:hypothetical protein